jgi:hypothetical protein
MSDAMIAEPSESDKLEALRTATAMIRMTNENRLTDVLRYWDSLSEYEQGCAVGTLAQWSVLGIRVWSTVRGVSFDEALQQIDDEIAENIKGG